MVLDSFTVDDSISEDKELAGVVHQILLNKADGLSRMNVKAYLGLAEGGHLGGVAGQLEMGDGHWPDPGCFL